MKDRIIEMLGRDECVELVCIDREEFLSDDPYYEYSNSTMLYFNKIIVDSVVGRFINIKDPLGYRDFTITDYELRYFKIKEPTFNELIDVAVQAVKDGVIDIKTLCMDSIRFTPRDETDNVATYFDDEYADSFDYIKSLYTETFTIEEHRFPELKVGGIFTQNGNDVVLDADRIDAIMNTPLFLIKGAKVTQKKGK